MRLWSRLNDASTVDVLVGAAWALDRSKEDAKSAAMHAAFHAAAFAFDHRRMPRSPPYSDDDVFDLARHLLTLRRGFPVRLKDDPRDVACEGASGVLRELLGSEFSSGAVRRLRRFSGLRALRRRRAVIRTRRWRSSCHGSAHPVVAPSLLNAEGKVHIVKVLVI